MKVKGFKAFSSSMTNHYGITFEEHQLYTIPKNIEIKYGKEGNGFHFAKNMEDTLRYVNGMNEDIYIASVIASGEIVQTEGYEDIYYGYDEVFATRNLYIEHIYTREEIMNYILNLTNHYSTNRVIRFLRSYKLTEDEIKLLKEVFSFSIKILKAIAYYQEGDLEVYNRAYIKKK